jgi:hypothetical protein
MRKENQSKEFLTVTLTLMQLATGMNICELAVKPQKKNAVCRIGPKVACRCAFLSLQPGFFELDALIPHAGTVILDPLLP